MQQGQARAQYGDQVRILVIGTLKNGKIFEQTPQDKPLEFTIGNHEVIKGLEMAVQGMFLGEVKNVEINASAGFGIKKSEHVQAMPRNMVPKDFKIEKGKRIAVQKEGGISFQATVLDFDNEQITLDFNHPLAGEDLIFQIKLIAILPKQPPHSPIPQGQQPQRQQRQPPQQGHNMGSNPHPPNQQNWQ